MQPTHRELAPEHAAGKVPVPLGRECQWETTGQRLKRAVKLCVELSVPLGRECQWETTGQRLKRAVKLCVELFARELATCSSTVMP